MDINQQQAENLDKTSLSDVSQNKDFEDDDAGIETEEEKIVEPFDPTKIKIDARQITIDLVLNRIRFGEIELSPDFQRESNIWNDVAKSRLIESMLIRIPLPAFYIDATDENKWVVIDGQQRLTAIKHFVLDEDKFRLFKLEFLTPILRTFFEAEAETRIPPLVFASVMMLKPAFHRWRFKIVRTVVTQFDGKNYDELPRNYQRRISETQITIYLIETGTPEELKFNIFRRINTGGLPLSSQEIRHALNQGKVTKFLEKLAKTEEFKKATVGAVTDKRMAAREAVLRFLAFKITNFLQYNATDLDTFLNNAMKMMNNMPEKDLENLESDFLKAMTAATDIFGNDAFRKRLDKKAGRSPFNKALFETWAVNLSSLNKNQIETLRIRKDTLIDGFIELNADRSFIDSISEGTGAIGRVKYRFSKIQDLIDKVLKATTKS